MKSYKFTFPSEQKLREMIGGLKLMRSEDRVPVMVKIPRELHEIGRTICGEYNLTWNEVLALGLIQVIELIAETDGVSKNTHSQESNT